MGRTAPASATRRQKAFNADFAPAGPLAVNPLTSTTAFIAPADVPEIPSMRSQDSSMSRSSTPQVKSAVRSAALRREIDKHGIAGSRASAMPWLAVPSGTWRAPAGAVDLRIRSVVPRARHSTLKSKTARE